MRAGDGAGDVMALSFDYLLVIEFPTTVPNPRGDPRGSPEIVTLSWIAFDMAAAAMVDSQQLVVRPIWAPELTRECLQRTGLAQELVNQSYPLPDCLQQLDTYICQHFLHQNKTFCFLSDNGSMKDILCTEALRKGLSLAPHYSTVFNICTEFARCFPRAPAAKTIDDVAQCAFVLCFFCCFYVFAVFFCLFFFFLFLLTRAHTDMGIECAGPVRGIEKCMLMGSIVAQLLRNGHVFATPDMLDLQALSGYLQSGSNGPESKGDAAEAGAGKGDEEASTEPVVRLRGLPWDTSMEQIKEFFQGLKIYPNGVVLCRSSTGRPNGEGFVRFVELTDQALGLERDRGLIGKRYIEIFPSGLDEMESAIQRQIQATLTMRTLGSPRPFFLFLVVFFLV